MSKFLDISKYVGAFMVIQAGLGFIAKPFLDDYIDSHIEAHKKAIEEEESNKQSFRSLLAPKMEVDEDETHIGLGKLYREEEKVWNEIKAIKSEIRYYHPSTVLK